jgi:hypothetical protein
MFIFDIFNQFPIQFPLSETLASAAAAAALGILWYHPKILGQKWVDEHRETRILRLPIMAYIIGAFLWVLSAAVYSFLTHFLTPPTIGALLGLSTFIWVGFILPSSMINGFYCKQKLMTTAVDSSYYLAGLYLFAVVHWLI